MNLKVTINLILYRLTGGRIGGRYRGVEILLLEHMGRKSGKKRLTPLYYIQDGDRYLIAASDQGAAKNPGWYWNILGDAPVKIHVRDKVMPVKVTEVTGAERDQLFERFLNLKIDNYVRYQQRTSRKIPVLILTPEKGST